MHLGIAIKVLHSDCGGEYLDKGFVLYLKSRGMEQKLTMHDTPSHNSVTMSTKTAQLWSMSMHYSTPAVFQNFYGEKLHAM